MINYQTVSYKSLTRFLSAIGGEFEYIRHDLGKGSYSSAIRQNNRIIAMVHCAKDREPIYRIDFDTAYEHKFLIDD